MLDEHGAWTASHFRRHNPVHERIRAANTGPITRHLRRWDTPLPDTDQPTTADWLGFACVLIRSSTLRDVGPLDEGYFLYLRLRDARSPLVRAGAAGGRRGIDHAAAPPRRRARASGAARRGPPRGRRPLRVRPQTAGLSARAEDVLRAARLPLVAARSRPRGHRLAGSRRAAGGRTACAQSLARSARRSRWQSARSSRARARCQSANADAIHSSASPVSMSQSPNVGRGTP
jgi:hypothetical protein